MLEVKNLVKKYKAKGGVTVTALDHVSLKFPDKGMVFLLGKSGSGKSTLLNVIGGLDRPDDGEIIIKGKNSKSFSGADFDSYRNTFIGFIFQEYNILNEFNVEQNISLALQLQGKPNDKATVNALLKQVDLGGLGKRKPNTLSGGQKQRVAIARALIKNPEIIMADEPTGALDSNTGKQVFDTLKKLSEEKLVIVVSHDRDFAEIYGDRIIELSDGKIITDVTKEFVEAKKIGDNVSIINENTISITDASKLKKEDMDTVFNILKKQKGEVIVSSGERSIGAVKQAVHINESNASETFKETKEISVKEYDPKATKFIRSHLPFSRAFKMGSSSLKTKPIRLIFTSFLTTVSLAMFGLTSTLMLFDANYAVSRAMKASDRNSEEIKKEYDYKVTRYEIDNSTGEKKKDYSYSSDSTTMLSAEDIEQLNKNNAGLKFAGIYKFNNAYVQMPFNRDKSDSYYCFTAPSGLMEIDNKVMNDHGLNLIAGRLPTVSNEVALPDYLYNSLTFGIEEIKSYQDLFDSSILLKMNDTDKKQFLVTGIVDAGTIPSKFDVFKNENLEMSVKEKDALLQEFGDFVNNSYHTYMYVAPTFYEEVYSPLFGESDIYANDEKSMPRVSVEDIQIIYEGQYAYDGKFYYEFSTDELIEHVKDSVTVYDLDGKKIEMPKLKGADILLSKSEYESLMCESMAYYLEKAAYLYREGYQYDEELNNAIGNSSNRDAKVSEIGTLANRFFNEDYKLVCEEEKDSINEISQFIKTYYVRAERNRKIIHAASMYIDAFERYGLATYPEYETFQGYFRGYINHQNYSHFEDMKNFLLEDRDGLVKINNVISFCSQKPFDDTTNDFIETYMYSSNRPSDEEVDAIYNHIKTKYGMDVSSSLDITNITDEMVLKSINYLNKKRQYGTFNVVGYYAINSNNGYYNTPKVVAASFLRENTTMNEYSTLSIKSTKYIPTGANRYGAAISRTNYSKEQISILLGKGNAYRYQMSNSTYQKVQIILSFVNMLKTTFLVIGIVFGTFAALMLLNFIATSIASKTKEIGILRAVGARGSDLFKIFFSESGLITIICLVLALIGSYVGCYFMNEYMVKEAGIAFLDFGLINIGIIVAGAFIISFIGTFLPVLIAAKKPPVESIRTL